MGTYHLYRPITNDSFAFIYFKTMGQSCSSAPTPSSAVQAPARISNDFDQFTVDIGSMYATFMTSSTVQNQSTPQILALPSKRKESTHSTASLESDMSDVIGRIFEQEKLLWGSILKWTPTKGRPIRVLQTPSA